MCSILMDKDDPISNFFTLRELDRLDFLPDTFDIEKTYIEYSLINNKDAYNYIEADSIVLVSQSKDSIRNRSYNTYYYKYSKKINDVPTWYLMTVLLKSESDKPGDLTYLKSTEKFNEEEILYYKKTFENNLHILK